MNEKRLKILSKSEINELYGIPQFTTNEKQAYFSLSKKEYKIMSERGSLASKVHFILQLAYFKATSQFFNCKFAEVKLDVDFILQQHFDNAKLHFNAISQKTCQSNQTLGDIVINMNVSTSNANLFRRSEGNTIGHPHRSC